MRTAPLVLACILAGAALTAQEKPQPPSEQPRAMMPSKVQIVFSRFKGDKKVSSLPYTLGVITNERMKTSLRMGMEVPIGSKTQGYSYKNLGTNIDCTVESAARDYFRVTIVVSDTSLYMEAGKPEPPAGSGIVSDIPAYRGFNSSFVVLLRDGQTTQLTSAVDPVSGEVLKVDVTLDLTK